MWISKSQNMKPLSLRISLLFSLLDEFSVITERSHYEHTAHCQSFVLTFFFSMFQSSLWLSDDRVVDPTCLLITLSDVQKPVMEYIYLITLIKELMLHQSQCRLFLNKLFYLQLNKMTLILIIRICRISDPTRSQKMGGSRQYIHSCKFMFNLLFDVLFYT